MTLTRTNEIDAARQRCYHFFSIVLSDPRSAGWQRVADANYRMQVSAAAAFLREESAELAGDLAPGERAPAEFHLDAALASSPDFEQIESEHQRIFGFLLAKDCPPYETEYCPQTFSIYRSQRIGDVAGYYRAFGVEPGREVPERHDHIALELEFMAWVIGKEHYARLRGDVAAAEQSEICRHAQAQFFEAHLGWWVPAFARALEEKAEGRRAAAEHSTFYGSTAAALSAFVAFDRLYLGIAPPTDLVVPRPLDDGTEMGCGGCEVDGQPDLQS